jgi:hypothetical protein
MHGHVRPTDSKHAVRLPRRIPSPVARWMESASGKLGSRRLGFPKLPPRPEFAVIRPYPLFSAF